MKTNLLILALLILCESALAQNCAGMPAVNGVCIPPDSPTSPLYSTYGQHPDQAVEPRAIWANRWGAIAVDPTNSGVGTAVGMSSKRMAESVAMNECRANGGNGCEVELAYQNECGVIVWGDENYTTVGSATVERATELAIQDCSKHTNNCRIYYADCSLAERIQ